MAEQHAGEQCEHPNCQCRTSSADAVDVGGHHFCSATCSRGEGCSHPDCGCAEHTA
jgi:hypothetical protein